MKNSISKSDPVNINTQQSSFLLQMKTMYLETSKMFQQMQVMMFQANAGQFVYPQINAVSVLSHNKNASTTSTPGKSETIKKKKLKKIRCGRKKKKCKTLITKSNYFTLT